MTTRVEKQVAIEDFMTVYTENALKKKHKKHTISGVLWNTYMRCLEYLNAMCVF